SPPRPLLTQPNGWARENHRATQDSATTNWPAYLNTPPSRPATSAPPFTLTNCVIIGRNLVTISADNPSCLKPPAACAIVPALPGRAAPAWLSGSDPPPSFGAAFKRSPIPGTESDTFR